MPNMAKNAVHDPKPLDAYKRDAARLLKAARSDDELQHASAMQRFGRLVHAVDPEQLQLKHALAVVALEAGFSGWPALKQAKDELDFSEFFAAPGLKDSINHWFASYDEARAHQQAHGGILLPYRHQCFVTSTEILPRMGFERDDPDWTDIGHDFVRPASETAHARIVTRLQRRFATKD